jgi:pyruvate dehydrogenase E1 component alpha subunit
MRECLGHPDGLCGGKGGHMHLFSKEHLAASSGIVGAAGPTAAGFGLAAQYSHPGAIVVAFFGEGAMNQGMLMESLNLASAWKLPVFFVCKDDNWSIVTKSEGMTGGDLKERARAFGLPVAEVDGCDVQQVWEASRAALEHLRSGQGPYYMHANCIHLEGHFLGLQLLRAFRDPLREMPGISIPLTRSFLRLRGAGPRERLSGLREVLATMLSFLRDPRRDSAQDPVRRARKLLLSEPEALQELEDRVEREMGDLLASGTAEVLS